MVVYGLGVSETYQPNVGSLSIDMSADCRTTTLGRHIDRNIGRVSFEISPDITVDFLVNMSTETSRSIYRPSVSRHVDRHIDRASTDTRPICRPICRPIYRSRGAQNTHNPIQLGRLPTSPATLSEGKHLSIDCIINKRDFVIFCYDFANDNEAIGNTFSSYIDTVLPFQ